MKNILIASILSIVLVCIGFSLGWWVNSPNFDILCSKPAVSILAKDIEAEGISISAGTEVNLRTCEYASRYTINLYSPKGENEDLFKFKNSSPNVGNHEANQYNAKVAK